MYLDIVKNRTPLRGVHLAKVIHDRHLEIEDENGKIPILVTSAVCRVDTELNNNIIISILWIIRFADSVL